jgi:hypothetical protein
MARKIPWIAFNAGDKFPHPDDLIRIHIDGKERRNAEAREPVLAATINRAWYGDIIAYQVVRPHSDGPEPKHLTVFARNHPGGDFIVDTYSMAASTHIISLPCSGGVLVSGTFKNEDGETVLIQGASK